MTTSPEYIQYMLVSRRLEYYELYYFVTQKPVYANDELYTARASWKVSGNWLHILGRQRRQVVKSSCLCLFVASLNYTLSTA